MKVGSALMTWSRSATGEVTKQVLDYSVDDVPQSWELPADMTEFVIERIAPFQTITFKVTTYGADGQSTMSMSFTIVAPSFEAPLPATNLGVSFFNIREETEPTPPEVVGNSGVVNTQLAPVGGLRRIR